MRRYRQGFSLIELAAVLVILALFAGLGFWGLERWRDLEESEQVKQDLACISRAKHLWRMDYPDAQFPVTESNRWQALLPYLRTPPQPPEGRQYLINDLSTDPAVTP